MVDKGEVGLTTGWWLVDRVLVASVSALCTKALFRSVTRDVGTNK